MSTPTNDNPIKAEKRRKLHALREKGINPFPYSFERTGDAETIKQTHEALKPGEKSDGTPYRIAGRVMTLRSMGKAIFFNIQDMTGSIQIYLRVDDMSEKDRTAFELTDLGDIVGVEGFPFRTQKGELSIWAKSYTMLTKTLEPLPEKFHGIQDVEIKYRHRHLDLISDLDSRAVFAMRSKVIQSVRRYLDGAGFMEVETPILQPIYGGAAAHPFTTHHRALDMRLFMRISPELYLKRLIVGGFDKVYDIGKMFRNEGIDRTHNPEFTMVEWYEAYTDYNDQMKRFEELVSGIMKELTGSYKIQFQGKEVDFTPPWRRLTVMDGLREYAQIDPDTIKPQDLYDLCRKHGSKMTQPASQGQMLMDLFELTCEEYLWQPTFVMDHPVEISPLTKIHRKDHRLVERFEPFAACMEIGNSYSELNDPEEQRNRLHEQESQRATNDEAHPMDEDFLHAIETGMPPTGGVGLGIERLVMLVTNRPSIRDIILFPTMKFK